ncbi:SAM-dependent methyltransferase [Halapricum desulfuricans]|uniref:SAM-dependent methyltransferase n=1 Tax=Halapricum desulfuricans TaxID=2841257 RepID=A0A897NGS2_9EURY|nr:class I SAM-dependent methyltransferase [Halapricum desulfuricans]QSG11788.1 SAM-dependent methyltransferase [Halapricum desulfuricans]
MEQLYTDYPELYDAIQSEWDYDRDCAFVRDLLDGRDPEDLRLLEIGCRTGEHTRRFAADGYDVTAMDPNEGMLSRAKEKIDVDYHAAGVPGIPVDSEFDVVVAIDVGEADDSRYARIVQMNPDGDRLRWDQIVFTPDGHVCVDTRPMTPFDDLDIAVALAEHGLDAEPVDGYGPDDDRTVFVCTPR